MLTENPSEELQILAVSKEPDAIELIENLVCVQNLHAYILNPKISNI